MARFTSARLLAFAVAVALLVLAGEVSARRIVAIGDLHGDYNQSRAVLTLTRLIDNENHWIGEDAVLVQLGDILDVGPDDIKIVKLLMRIRKEALASGGDVVELLGNHEMRNFRGDYLAVDPDSLAAHGGKEGRDLLLSNKTDVGMYLRTRKAIFHYGPFLFMHGGLSTASSNTFTDINSVNEFNKELSRALVNGTISPLASRGLDLTESNADDVANPILVRSILNVKCDDLAKVLSKRFPGIQSVVVGHVPHDPRDFADWRLCGGHLIDIDFGLSRWKKGDPGHVAALEISDPTWHMQLIEATLQYSAAAEGADGQSGRRIHSFVRLSVFIILLTLTIVAIVYLLRLRDRRNLETRDGLLEDDSANDYGTL